MGWGRGGRERGPGWVRRSLPRLGICAAIAAAAWGSAIAAQATDSVVEVDTLSESTLRDALDSVGVGGTVRILDTGTLVLSAPLVFSKDVTVEGSGIDDLVLTHPYPGVGPVTRALQVPAGHDVTLTDLTVDGSQSREPENGGLIHNAGTLTLRRVTVRNGSAARDGGGLYNLGRATIEDSHFEDNVACMDPPGGGHRCHGQHVYNSDALLVTGTSFASTVGSPGVLEGGAIYTTLGHSSVKHSTFSGMGAFGGGGIFVAGGGLVLEDSAFTGTTAGNGVDDFVAKGGAIYYAPDTLSTVRRTTFEGTSSFGSGGAIHNDGGGVTVLDSSFVGTRSFGGSGGAIEHQAGLLLVSGSVFRDSQVQGAVSGINAGGAIRVRGGSVHLREDRFLEGAAQYGAGIAVDAGSVAIRDSTFSGLVATDAGAGVYNRAGEVTVRRSTFHDNVAGIGGGAGVATRLGSTSITNSTFSGNFAGAGSVVGASGGSLHIAFTTIVGNTVTRGGSQNELAGSVVDLVLGTVGNMTNSIVAGNSTTGVGVRDVRVASSPGWVSGGHNIVGDVSGFGDPTDLVGVDPKLGPLAANGGPTLTHALRPDSPAIDAAGGACRSDDQRDASRPQLDGCDIGAFEAAPADLALFDTDPPVVTLSTDATPGPRGWFDGPVTVTLSCSDGDGLGCDQIYWKHSFYDVWTLYTGPFVVDFPGGPLINYYGVDVAGNEGDPFVGTMLLQDHEPPVLHLPDPIAVDAQGPSGAHVTYPFEVTDEFPTSQVHSSGCTPASGSLFATGVTTVHCEAMDGAGNTASGSFTVQVSNPVATITTVSPAAVEADGDAFTLTVEGSGFVPGSTVEFNGSPRPTALLSGRLEAQIPASDLIVGATPAVALVTVVNPTPGGGTSAPVALTVVGPDTAAAASSVALAGGTASAETLADDTDEPGVRATLDAGEGGGPAVVTAAVYEGNPTGTDVLGVGGSFVDLRVEGAGSGAALDAHVYYPSTVAGAAEEALALLYFDGTDWFRVRGSGGGGPAKDTTDDLDGTVSGGRFSVTLDETSSPRLSELSGTVFTAVALDSEPPVTTATVSGTEGDDGWFKSGDPVTLSLDAADDLAGVGTTTITVDGGAAQMYRGPLTFGDGEHSVTYFSTDAVGNVEQVRSLTVKVDQTPPAVTAAAVPAPNASGWNAEHVTVTASGTDVLSGVDPIDCETVVLEGEGTNLSATVSCRDRAGNSGSASIAGIDIDRTAPSTAAAVAGSEGESGWYVGAVQVSLSATDQPGLSGVDGTSYRVNGGSWEAYIGALSFSADGRYTLEFASTDAAGNAEKTRSITFWIDQTAPQTVAEVAGIAGDDGWFKAGAPVSLTLRGGDAMSGVAATTYRVNGGAPKAYTGPVTFGDGTYTVTYFSEDEAGNREVAGTVTFKVDQTAPELRITGVEEGGSYLLGLPEPGCDAADALSGLASPCSLAVAAPTTASGAGSYTVTATVTDGAGNAAAAVATYDEVYDFGGFEPPLDKKDTYQRNQAILVEFELRDGSGALVHNTEATLAVNGAPAEGKGRSNEGDRFRSSGGAYTYILDTKGLDRGPLTLSVSLDDGRRYAIVVQLR